MISTLSKAGAIWKIVGIVTLGIAMLLGACVPKPTRDSAPSFAISGNEPVKNSLLNVIAKGAGLKVCLAFADSLSQTERESDEWRRLVSDVIENWNDALTREPPSGWPVKKVDLTFDVRFASSCPGSEGDRDTLKINVWNTLPGWEMSVTNPALFSHAEIRTRTIRVHPRTTADRALRPVTLLHEYGHLLGLGDTYVRPGWSEPADQPRAMMNNYKRDRVSELQDDDIRGVRALWALLRTGVMECGEGYEPGEFKSNSYHYFFCVPSVPGAGGVVSPAAK